MELPDFMSYANKFSQSDFVEKISRIAKRAGAAVGNGRKRRRQAHCTFVSRY